MTQAQLIADILDDVVLAAFFASLAFIVSYTAMAPWWRHQHGTSLVVMDAGLVLALGPAAVHRLFGFGLTYELWYGWYDVASITLVAGGVVWRTIVQVIDNWDNPRMIRIRASVAGWAAYARTVLVGR